MGIDEVTWNVDDGVCGDFVCARCGGGVSDGIGGVDDFKFCPFCGKSVIELPPEARNRLTHSALPVDQVLEVLRQHEQ